MVGDGRWHDAACLQAQPAQWLDHELMRSAALPACGAVPAVDIRTERHRGQGLLPFRRLLPKPRERGVTLLPKPRERGVSKPNAFGLPHTEKSLVNAKASLTLSEKVLYRQWAATFPESAAKVLVATMLSLFGNIVV
jgi:hypothetical protein